MSVKPFADLKQGDTVRWRHEVTADEVDSFARLSGDVNPLHLDDAFAEERGFRGRVVHGALVNAFISRILGTELPGPGCLWLSQTTRFAQPVYVADPIEVVVRVTHKSESLRMLVLETTVQNLRGETLLQGEAKVSVPAAKVAVRG
jgi:acyl dehydratase